MLCLDLLLQGQQGINEWLHELAPPAPRIELVVLEALYHGMIGIHQHLVEVLARLALVAQIAHSHPPTIWVFPGLVVKVQEDILAQEPGAGIVGGGLPFWAGFCASRLGSVDIGQPDSDSIT